MINKILLISIIFFLFFSGCQKSEPLTQINGTYPFYFEAYLESGKYAIIYISKLTSITSHLPLYTKFNLDNYNDSVNQFYKGLNAHVTLLKDGIVVDSLSGPYNNITNNNYDFLRSRNFSIYPSFLQGSSHIIQEGGNYTMVVKIPSHPAMTATCTVPYKVDIQKLDTIRNGDFIGIDYNISILDTSKYPLPDSIYSVPVYNFKLSFLDPSTQQNYYRLEYYTIYKNTSYFKNIYKLWEPISGVLYIPLFENKYIFLGFTGTCPFFNDKLINGLQEMIDLEKLEEEDSAICINLVSISQGYYDRLKSEDLFNANLTNMFAAPVTMYSNFSNASGFLAGRSVSTDTITFKPILISINNNSSRP
jgi:hypothetical protein